jgi:hypothetical protein
MSTSQDDQRNLHTTTARAANERGVPGLQATQAANMSLTVEHKTKSNFT